MPINRDLNVDPYFDDFNLEKQFYRVLFKPSYAVQARELTQLQTILQNQIEQFGDNIFKEGSIIKGCNFTELNDLQYVKVTDKAGFDVNNYVGFEDTEEISGEIYTRDNSFELRGDSSGVTARIVAVTRGFETRNPDLNTFYINYNNTSSGNKVFQSGELLRIYKISTTEVGTSINVTETLVDTINVTTFALGVGQSFGLRSAPGVIFQKGHFLYTEEQLVILSKYNNTPDAVSVGFSVEERIISALQDSSLYDNANGSFNQNAPGADRLKLVPVLTAISTQVADRDTTFFTLVRYSNGNAITLRDVSQYNALGEEMARRTYEESGDYVVSGFKTKVVRRNGNLKASIGSGLAYVKGFRVETLAESLLDIDPIANTSIDDRSNQAVSFKYGGYMNLSAGASAGVVPLNHTSTVTLRDGGSSNIGTARVKNITNDKIFLFDVRMTGSNKISAVEEIVGTSGVLYVANNSIINDAGNAQSIFDSGMISLYSTSSRSIPIRDSRGSQPSANTITLSPTSVDEDFNVGNDDILFVDGTNQKIDVVDASLSGSDLVLTLGSTPASGGTVYFNKRLVDADPFIKASTRLYVKSTFANTDISTSSKFNLGFPDVYDIVSITDADGNDVTNSFRLRTNQRDNYYDHSYVEFIPGRPAPVEGLMTITIDAFKINTHASRHYFFTVDSYPDVQKNKIQPFTSASGKVYTLTDCLDFRPYVTPLGGATYAAAEVLGTAPTVSSSSTSVNVAPTFNTNGGGWEILSPAYNEFAQIDYEYYLNRTDAITIDSYGTLSVVKGTETEYSFPPSITGDQLKIADVYVPGIPSLTPEEATAQERLDYSIRVSPKGIKSYRMKDIENLERKVDSLRYYVLLSALEAETKNLNIIDENGLSRFKNGIIVDPFNDLSIADVKNTEFNSAIDFTEKSLMPAVKTFPLNLKYSAASSASIFPSTSNPKFGTLQRNLDVSIISQPYATAFRNCTSNFYSYRGTGALSPDYDALYDTTTNPVSLDIDLATPINSLVDAIQEFIPLTSTSSTQIARSVDTSVRWLNFAEQETATTTTTLTNTTTRSVQIGETVSEQNVGDFVSNFSFNPYMRARDINIYMSGLRPNTIHYFFFDQVNVDSFITPGSPVDSADEITKNGVAGGTVTSDANGVIRAVFSIPAETFFVGDRKLEVVDVNQYDSIESGSTSYGFLTYHAYNFSVEKSSLTVSTRMPVASVATSTTTRSVSTRSVRVVNFGGMGDPIAQTFFIKSGMGQNSDTVFISKLDIYFKRKSSINGVTVEIREVENGYPSYSVVPLSRVHLTPSQVNVSDDASQATTVTFQAPIRLDVEKEYAFVVIPDGGDPDYLIFTSKIGGTDLTPGETQGLAIVQDWGDGVLFTSTNNRAWKSYQDEDIKFNLYRHNFNVGSGTVTFVNDDHEFLTTENNIGRFTTGEIVYKLFDSDAATSNTVSVVSGSNQITGTGLSTTYAAGDYIILDDGSTNKQILKVNSASSTVIVADRPVSFTATLACNPITVGTLVHYDPRYPTFIILEGSSATASRKFASSDTIYGFDSDTTATIASVDNKEFSYIQPMINRTNDAITRTDLSGTFTIPSNPSTTYNKNILFNDKTTFGKNGMVIFSKSNDIVREKGLKLIVSMTNNSNVTSSPFVDLETASLLAYEWKITDASETTSKYVSKTVELVESLDAEDMQVFVTGYRPNGTDIKVFIRPQAANDPAVFDTIDWIELEKTQGVNLYSSISNIYDFREFVYSVPASAKSDGVLQYTNDLSQTFEGYRRFAIKIELHSDSIFKAPRLLDYRGIALT